MTNNPYDAVSIIIAGVGISVIGALFYNVMPVYLGAAQEYRQLSNSQLGYLVTAFFAGYNLVTISAFFWIRRWSWRRIGFLALPMALSGMGAATLVQGFTPLLLCTAVAGGGFSALYGIGTTVLAETSNPARWYGVKIAAEAIPGVILLSVLPGTLIQAHGFNGAVLGIVIAALVIAPLLVGLPRAGSRHDESAEQALRQQVAAISPSAIWCALLSLLLFVTATSSVWAFLERLGDARGFGAEAIGIMLSLTLVAATCGALLTAVLGEKFGNSRPFHLGSALLLGALVALLPDSGFTTYAAAACTFNFCFAMCLPFAVAEIAQLDHDGRFVILSVPAIGTGAMVGPGLSGALSDAGGYGTVILFAIVLVLAANILLLYSTVTEARKLQAGQG